MAHTQTSGSAVCQCGETTLELIGDPIQSVTCYCESCRSAARVFERELGAPQTVTDDGGVDYCLYRKDRVKIATGADRLREYRLKPDSPTRRVVARCCNSPMFVDFTPGHWLTVFRHRLSGPAPETQMQIMTKDKPEGVQLSSAAPAFESHSPRLMLMLMAAWARMGFRRPKMAW